MNEDEEIDNELDWFLSEKTWEEYFYDCECGLKEDGTWSEEVFDRYGCSCEESEDE